VKRARLPLNVFQYSSFWRSVTLLWVPYTRSNCVHIWGIRVRGSSTWSGLTGANKQVCEPTLASLLYAGLGPRCRCPRRFIEVSRRQGVAVDPRTASSIAGVTGSHLWTVGEVLAHPSLVPLFVFSLCSDSGMGSAPFPLFSRVILPPIFSRADSAPTHKIKTTERARHTDKQVGSQRV
jgi:hypothetical protein